MTDLTLATGVTLVQQDPGKKGDRKMTALPPPTLESPPSRPWYNRVPVWVWIVGVIAIALGVQAVVTGGFIDDDDPSPSEAFCNDLDDGYTLMNLWPRDVDPADFASDSYGRIAVSCPDHLEPNRAYFAQWGIDIDA